jgi:hypothetical protein
VRFWRVIVKRTIFLAVLLMSAICSGNSQTKPEPAAVTISIYAPEQPEQKDTPVHIVALHYGHSAITMRLHNDSNKTVTSVDISGLIGIPSGCSLLEEQSSQIRRKSVAGSAQHLNIGGHRMATTTRNDAPFHPPVLVMVARDANAVYLHVQAVIATVTFSDGSTWRAKAPETPEGNPGGLLEPRLLEAEMEACTRVDVASAVDALTGITAVGFSPRLKLTSTPADAQSSPPRLLFRCSLDGRLATCPQLEE